MDRLLLWSIVTAVILVTFVIATLIRGRRFQTLLPRAATLIPPSNSVVWFPNTPATPDAIIAAPAVITAPELFDPEYLHEYHDTIFPTSSDRGLVAVLEGPGGDSVMMPDITARQALENLPDNGVIDPSVLASVAAGGFFGVSLAQCLGGTLSDRKGRAAIVVLLGLGGAILGGVVSTRVKAKRFRAALEAYDAARANALRDIEDQRRIAQLTIKRFIEDRDKAMHDAINEERRKFLAVARDGRRSVGNERRLACKAFASHLGAIEERIWTGFKAFRETHQSSIFTRWLYPREGDVAVELAGRWAQAASRRVEQLRMFLLVLLSSPDEDKWDEAARVISQFMRTFECDADEYCVEIKANANRLAAIQRGIDEQAEALDGRLKRLLADARREISAFADATDVRLHERVSDAVKSTFEALDRVRSAARG